MCADQLGCIGINVAAVPTDKQERGWQHSAASLGGQARQLGWGQCICWCGLQLGKLLSCLHAVLSGWGGSDWFKHGCAACMMH
jgi:hypothetical protein